MNQFATVISADWLRDRSLRQVIAAIAQEQDLCRIVGGAVRNTLMGLLANDIDIATTALPETVLKRAQAAGLKAVPTGILHGTITVVADGKPFEVTTLRRDVATNGRHASVEFGTDWEQDALRRDFTVNALFATPDGAVIDFVGGIADCRARIVRFIGRAEDRISEDYLRILRFFRFTAHFGGVPDAAGLSACLAQAGGIAQLSAERVGQEMKKLVVARGAPETLTIMKTMGILARVIDLWPQLTLFNALHDLVRADLFRPSTDDAPLFLATLCKSHREAEALAARLRLSNAERDRMMAATEAAPEPVTEKVVRWLRYMRGADRARDALILAAARNRAVPLAAHRLLLETFTPPQLPVRGSDFMAYRISGPDVGEKMREAERLWVESDFSAGREEILRAMHLM